jgi:hypothetical protein
MGTEKRQKERLSMKDPKKAWEVIENLMLDEEELTDADLDAALKERGINPDACLDKVFQAVEKIARDPNRSGRVSSHVSDILSQLSRRHRSKKKNLTTEGQPVNDTDQDSPNAVEAPKAKVVKNFYRNFKKASTNDRQIFAKGEKLLEKKAEELARKKRTPE